MNRPWNGFVAAGCAVAWIIVGATSALAQEEPVPNASFLLSGYGTVNYTVLTDEDVARNDFTASLNPVVLYSLGEDILVEAEFEVELEEGATEIGLEYAQANYLGFDRVLITAGKFLLPFGVFGERLHPTWINKLPGMPLVFGHGHGGVAEGALLPILADVGLMVRLNQPLNGPWAFDLSAYVTQGPKEVVPGEEGADGHVHSVLPALDVGNTATTIQPRSVLLAQQFDIPSVAFGSNFSDNNDNKMLGARAGLVRGGTMEFYVSGFHAMYDEGDHLDIYGTSLSAEWRSGPLEVRGEGAVVWQEFEQADGSFPTLRSPGYYLQTSYRIRDFEPAVRWSHLTDAKVSGEVVRDDVRQVAFGISYWLRPSVPVKVAFEINPDGNDRLLFQWAYGF